MASFDTTCVTCGEDFVSGSPRAKYCSEECKGAYGRTCPECGTKFRTHKKSKQFCSNECVREHQKDRVELTCEECGDVFKVPRSRSDATYCSDECHDTARRIYKECEYCGEEFKARTRDKYCCHECFGKDKQRDPRTCERCGEEYMPVYPAQEYCSLSCSTSARYAHLEVEVECATCGEPLTRRQWQVEKYDSFYCSPECNGGEGYKTVPCDYCGEPHERQTHRVEKQDNLYCSKQCHGRAQEDRVDVACGHCGEAMSVVPSRQEAADTLYCSRECATKAQQQEIRNGKAQCSTCREWLPIEEFPAGKTGGEHQIGSSCKDCERDRLNRLREERNRIKENGEDITPEEYEEILQDQDGRCFYCGVQMKPYHRNNKDQPHPHSRTVDHQQPLGRGGAHSKSNVVYACNKCNASKRDRTAFEFFQYRSITISIEWPRNFQQVNLEGDGPEGDEE